MLTKSRLWAAFKLLDKDDSGKISYDEVRRMLSVEEATGLNDEHFKQMVDEIDVDGDGLISFDEFEKMFGNEGGRGGRQRGSSQQ